MGIGTLNESPLHAALKNLVAEPGDRFEVPLDGYVIDVVRGDRLIEIQTADFAAMGRKLDHLLDRHEIRIVHPISQVIWLMTPDGSRRRSPRKGSIYSIFDELVRVPTLIDHPNLTIEVILITEIRHRVHDPTKRRGRGGWRVARRELEQVVDRMTVSDRQDLAELLPSLPSPFTTADLADAAGIGRDVAQRVCYCMRALDVVVEVGRTKQGIQYERLPLVAA